MAISFPANPINGQRYQAAGRTYVYNTSGDLWRDDTVVGTGANAAGITAYATIDDLPLTNVADGSQALILATNRLYIWNNTGWYQIALINTTPNITSVEDQDSNTTPFVLSTTSAPTVITVTATDPEGIPLTYDFTTSGMANTATVTRNDNVFTVTPSEQVQDEGTFDITFTASDGVNVASSIATFTLSFAVKVTDSRYTTALITAGDSSGDNTTIVDSSTSSHTLTTAGTTYLTSLSPYRHGGYSVKFDTNDSLSTDLSSDFGFGTGDFTMEGWFYAKSIPSSDPAVLLSVRSGSGGGTSGVLVIDTSGYIVWSNGTVYLGGTNLPITANEWFHVAVVNDSGTLKLFLNGNLEFSVADSTDYRASNPFTIGKFYGTSIGWFNGYASDVRVNKGTAVYTNSFTPPEENLTEVSGTVLLACHLPYIADSSSSGHSISIEGDIFTEPFAPYDNVSYSAINHGGSAYFDGGTSRIQVNSSTDFAFGTGDFTIEGWYNIPAADIGDNYLFDIGSNNLYLHISSNLLAYHNGIAHTSTNTFVDIAPLNSWNHIAVVRNSGITNVYVNGKTVDGLDNLTDTTDWASSATVTLMDYGPGSAGVETQGYVSDFRIVKGAAEYTTSFEPPQLPLSNTAETVLLLKFNEANIRDESQHHRLILAGDVQTSTAQTNHSTTSIAFDGTGDFISILSGDWKEYGTKDFTIEGWFWAQTSSKPLFGDTQASGVGDACTVIAEWKAGNYIQTEFRVGSTKYTIDATDITLSTQTWFHYAFVRNGNDFKVYIDGTASSATQTVSGAMNTTPNSWYIGNLYGTYPSSWDGYIEDFRITKGLARYTGAFTPPTESLEG